MTFEEWIFALHLLSAATLVGSLVMSWIVIVSLRSVDTAATTLGFNRVAMVGTVTTAVGLVGAIAFGIWLAILRDAFHVWDGWVIAAIVLWIVATLALWRSFVEYARGVEQATALPAADRTSPSAAVTAANRATTGLFFRAVGSLAIVLIVIDMIWKPGA